MRVPAIEWQYINALSDMTLNLFVTYSPKDMHENDPNSFIYNRPKLEIIQVLIKSTH